MAIIKWYKDGEFTEENVSDKLTIVKFRYMDRYSYGDEKGRFWIGYFENDESRLPRSSFHIIRNINSLEQTGKCPIKLVSGVSYRDSINIKIGNYLITNDESVESDNFKSWKYSDLVKKFGEENIMFYNQ